MSAGGEDGPQIVVAEQSVGGAPHMHHVLRMRADAAHDAEDGLHEKRRLDQLAVEEIGERVEMADIVALAFEAGAAAMAQLA